VFKRSFRLQAQDGGIKVERYDRRNTLLLQSHSEQQCVFWSHIHHLRRCQVPQNQVICIFLLYQPKYHMQEFEYPLRE
jgi:hypothetical protein